MAGRVQHSTWLAGDPGIVELIGSRDWSRTALGPIERWPENLRTTVSLALNSSFPINIIWGPGAVQIWNQAYSVICGEKHPREFGSDYRECWASAWPAIGGAFDSARSGRTAYLEDQPMFLDRNGYLEETSFTFSLSPIRDEAGRVAGLFHPVTETTARMLSGRRTRALQDLASAAAQADGPSDAAQRSIAALAGFATDLPFVLLYLADGDTATARLAASAGVPDRGRVSPAAIEPGDGSPVAAVIADGLARQIDLDEQFGAVRAGPYEEPVREALVLPVSPRGALVAGISTRLPLDATYRLFVELVAERVTASLAAAEAYERERERADALAEIDRAKTAFFSNVSHEFRTPLTLMLGPLEDELAETALEPRHRERIEVAHRNSLRLLRLVNALLEFSRLESGRVQASYRPTDLAAYTTDLASLFRSATERAGLELLVDCPPLAETVFVDRDMWEKIVTNLLSNAFKHTFEGTIAVRLGLRGDAAELTVQDTGVGIAADELPRLFERFHRVKDARARSFEGTGIGLSLARELARLHGGDIAIASEEGRGTTATVTLRLGAAHLPVELVRTEGDAIAPLAGHAGAQVDEVLAWLDAPQADPDDAQPAGERPRVLVADDNADMRAHVARLLERRFDTQAVADGAAALTAALADPPDLVLTDVMMPRLDGFGLVSALRRDERTKHVPVIMLSARAGKEAASEGIDAGADDYLVKPFAARELIARVSGTLALARQRREAATVLERVNRELEAVARAKTEFVANVSHEIRTPMNAVVGLTRLLQDTALDELQADYVDTIGSAGEHLLAVINDILDLSKLGAGRLEIEERAFDLRRVCREAVGLVAGDATQKGLALRSRIADDLPPLVGGDAGRVRQILVNLLSNAVKFTDGGEVALRVTAAGTGAAGRTNVRMEIADTGVGIAPDQLDRLFEPFTQAGTLATRSTGGTGLGLTISRELAELMGGGIDVRSVAGAGSTFTVRLPLGTIEADAGDGAGAPAQAPLGLQPGLAERVPRRILVVDDNIVNRKVVLRMLEYCGYRPDSAANGLEALEAVEREDYDVVLLDVQMPGMDGLEATREIRRRLAPERQPRIVGLTAAAFPEDRAACLAAGMDEQVTKPVSDELLVEVVAAPAGSRAT